MSSIIGSIRDFFSDKTSKLSTIQYSELQSLSFNGIPTMSYVLIGVTTVILASYTILDSGESTEENDEDKDESMLDKLPSMEGIKDTLSNFSPFKSSESSESSPPKEEESASPKEEEKEEEPPAPQEEEPAEKKESIIGGKKNKRNKTHSNKKSVSKKNKTHKSKK